MKKVKDEPNGNKSWSSQDIAYLQDQWGQTSIKRMAKVLGRSEGAVTLKASRLGLGAHLAGDSRISLNQLLYAIYGSTNGQAHIRSRLIQNGLPVKWHTVRKNRFRVIDIEDFWKWAEKNKSLLDFSRLEKYSLGAEPDWVDIKRKADFDKTQRQGRHNTAWTSAEDARLRRMLDKGIYTYTDLAKELRHSEGAVKRRIKDLGIQIHPVKNKPKAWTNDEVETLCRMVDQGYDYSQIADVLRRSALATRGKYERLQNPEYNRRYNRGQNATYEYQGIRSISGEKILEDMKLMKDVKFQELERVAN